MLAVYAWVLQLVNYRSAGRAWGRASGEASPRQGKDAAERFVAEHSLKADVAFCPQFSALGARLTPVQAILFCSAFLPAVASWQRTFDIL